MRLLRVLTRYRVAVRQAQTVQVPRPVVRARREQGAQADQLPQVHVPGRKQVLRVQARLRAAQVRRVQEVRHVRFPRVHAQVVGIRVEVVLRRVFLAARRLIVQVPLHQTVVNVRQQIVRRQNAEKCVRVGADGCCWCYWWCFV